MEQLDPSEEFALEAGECMAEVVGEVLSGFLTVQVETLDRLLDATVEVVAEKLKRAGYSIINRPGIREAIIQRWIERLLDPNRKE